MMLARRTLLQAATLGVGMVRLPAMARNTGADWVLAGGLDTDAAFARGVDAQTVLAMKLDARDYFALVSALKHPGQQLQGLLDIPRALLLEQAVRDSGARLLRHHSQISPAGAMAEDWAHAVGVALASGAPLPAQHITRGDPRIAIAVRT